MLASTARSFFYAYVIFLVVTFYATSLFYFPGGDD